KGCRQQPNIARPIVNYTRTDLNAISDRGEGCHRYNCVAHEPAFRLPDSFKSPFFRIARIVHAVADGMLVLQIERNALTVCHKGILLVGGGVAESTCSPAPLSWICGFVFGGLLVWVEQKMCSR